MTDLVNDCPSIPPADSHPHTESSTHPLFLRVRNMSTNQAVSLALYLLTKQHRRLLLSNICVTRANYYSRTGTGTKERM